MRHRSNFLDFYSFNRGKWLGPGVFLGLTLLIGCVPPQDSNGLSKGADGAVDRKLDWGIYEVPSPGQQTLDQFEAMAEKRPTLVGNNGWWLAEADQLAWSGFTNLYANPGSQLNNWANIVSDRGSTPVMLWNPYNPGSLTCNSGQAYFDNLIRYKARNIARGNFDTYIRRWARDVADFRRPILIRTMHELNAKKNLTTANPCQGGNSWEAGLQINGETINTNQDVIDAWRHIVSIFREEGATNARWVWSVLAWESRSFGGTNDIKLKDIYPGDQYVDWIGIECYNLPGNEWKSCTDRAQGIYNEAAALSTSKPLMMAEMGAYKDARKAQWITEALDPAQPKSIYKRFPRVQSIMYWNDNRLDTGELWINSSKDSALRFRRVIQSSVYRQPAYR